MVALVGCAGLSLFYSAPAFAAANVRPTITPSQATFTVPVGKSLMWTLRLWSHGNLEGSSEGTAGVLVVSVPHLSDCTFQADVTETAPGGSPQYYSGNRVTLTSCGVAPPAQTIAGHIYLCTPGGLPPTEVGGGTLSATGPQIVNAQANPLTPTTVEAGIYVMSASTPTGFLFVSCGGSATPAPDGLTASETLNLLSGGTQVGVFYVSAPPVGAGGGSTGPSSTGVPSAPDGSTGPIAPVPAAIASGHSPLVKVVPVAGTQLAFTGMNTETPLLIGLFLLALGLFLVTVARIRRSTDLLPIPIESTTDL